MRKVILSCCFVVLLAGLVAASGVSTGKPGMNHYPGVDDELPAPKPMYPGAPPVIRHGIQGMVLSRRENECLDCHTPPETHRMNAFTGGTSDTVIGIRYNCVQCHVPQAYDEPPYLKQ